MQLLVERLLYHVVIVVMAALLLHAARTQAALESNIPLTPKELFANLAASGRSLQVVVLRPLSAPSEDDAGAYLASHIPGALPVPNCELERAPRAAAARVSAHSPTVLVTKDGDVEAFRRCAPRFGQARHLEGGMAAWLDAGYPEEDGELMLPRAGAGGGCL